MARHSHLLHPLSLKTGDRIMSSQGKSEKLCDICTTPSAISTCEGCGKLLCKKCRSMEIYGSRNMEVIVKYFCPSCSKDPKINPPTDCKKVFGLEDVTDMVNQDQSKQSRFKIKVKMPWWLMKIITNRCRCFTCVTGTLWLKDQKGLWCNDQINELPLGHIRHKQWSHIINN